MIGSSRSLVDVKRARVGLKGPGSGPKLSSHQSNVSSGSDWLKGFNLAKDRLVDQTVAA